MKTNKEYQRAYRERMAEAFERFILYIPKEDYVRIMKIAEDKKWLSKTGKSAGAVNMQDALVNVLREGIKALEKNTGK